MRITLQASRSLLLAVLLAASSLAAAAPNPTPAPALPTPADPPAAPDAAPEPGANPAREPATTAREWRVRERLPWATAALGVALMGMGTGFALSAHGDRAEVRDALESAGQEHVIELTQRDAFALRDDADRKLTAGVVLGTLGVAALAGTIIWWYRDSSRSKKSGQPEVWLAPAARGLAVGGRF